MFCWGSTICYFTSLFSILQYALVLKYINCALVITLPKKERVLTLFVSVTTSRTEAMGMLPKQKIDSGRGKDKGNLKRLPRHFKRLKEGQHHSNFPTHFFKPKQKIVISCFASGWSYLKGQHQRRSQWLWNFLHKVPSGDWKMLEEVIDLLKARVKSIKKRKKAKRKRVAKGCIWEGC